MIKKILLFSMITSLFALLGACGGTKTLVTGPDIHKEETYQGIIKNEARLHAMLVGKFVQYNKVNKEKKYKTWMVNEGKDSVMIYVFPVGEPNKIGYWLYNYQVMTSLPNEPIYQSFTRLDVIDRDSIRGVYYEAPADFDYTVEEILANPTAIFEKVDLDNLEPSKEGEEVTYIRKTPLHFVGYSQYKESTIEQFVYMRDRYSVKPKGVHFSFVYYDENKENPKSRPPDRLVKLAVITNGKASKEDK